MKRTRLFAAILIITLSIAVLTDLIGLPGAIDQVVAGGPLYWRLDNFAEPGKVELRGATIDSQGAAILAPPLSEVFDTKQAYIWSTTEDQAGNLYLGTGGEGRVYRVNPAGQGALLCQVAELNVMALAVDARGTLYVGSSPDGKVYRVTPGGEAKVFFDPKSKYIWALAFDPQGRLLVATGEKGQLYRVTPDGASTVLATVNQSNLTALRVDRAGNAIIGTDPGGLVLRISPEGKVFTLFDSDQREIRDLAISAGPGGEESIYALALAESAGAGAATSAASAPAAGASPGATSGGLDGTVTVTLSDVQVIDGGNTTTVSPNTGVSSQAKSVLYRLNADGAWLSLWESREVVGFTLLPPVYPGGALAGGDVRLLLGVGQKGAGGEKGRILAIDPEPEGRPEGRMEPGTLTPLAEGQVARLARVGGRLFAATSNLGKLFLVGAGGEVTVPEGSVTGQVLDSVHHATWGALSWRGTGAIELQTRTGNTSTPDAAWSDWAPSRLSRVGSPAARYLQWRAILRRDTAGLPPRLREVTIHYLPRNLAPRVGPLTVLPVGVALQPPPPPQMEGIPAALQNEAATITNSVALPPRRVYQQGALSIQWQAEDRNGDQLEYAVFYRLTTGTELFPLRSGLRDTYLTIDSKELPDESYVFRVLASDRPANPTDRALTGQRESESVLLDNSPPELALRPAELSDRRVTIRATAEDRTSIIRRAEYQLDGRGWLPVFPVDGLADSRREEFTLVIDLPDRRPHLVAVRVFDANANIAIAQTSVTPR